MTVQDQTNAASTASTPAQFSLDAVLAELRPAYLMEIKEISLASFIGQADRLLPHMEADAQADLIRVLDLVKSTPEKGCVKLIESHYATRLDSRDLKIGNYLMFALASNDRGLVALQQRDPETQRVGGDYVGRGFLLTSTDEDAPIRMLLIEHDIFRGGSRNGAW